MTTTQHHTTHAAVADRFLEALAARDFDDLTRCLHPDARMQAVLQPCHDDQDGAEAIAQEFRNWFGAADDFEMVHAEVGRVGPRLRMSWRLRMQPSPLGPGWHLVEQHAFADVDADPDERITALDMVCSGYNPEDPG